MLTSNEQVVFAQERRFKPTPPVPETITFSPTVNLLAFTVKYTMGAVLLDPAELEADTVHMYVVPLDSLPEGIEAEFVVTLAEYTMPPLVLSTATE